MSSTMVSLSFSRGREMLTASAGQDFRQVRSGPMPGVRSSDGRYLGRPETIESVLYLVRRLLSKREGGRPDHRRQWRTTGDRQWQDRGWRMCVLDSPSTVRQADSAFERFVNWMEASITLNGFADIASVHMEVPVQLDKEESFVLAETCVLVTLPLRAGRSCGGPTRAQVQILLLPLQRTRLHLARRLRLQHGSAPVPGPKVARRARAAVPVGGGGGRGRGHVRAACGHQGGKGDGVGHLYAGPAPSSLVHLVAKGS